MNVSTYKPALLRCITNFSRKGEINIDWGDLSEAFFNIYYDRITKRNLPQLFQYGRISKVERIIKKYQIGKINKDIGLYQKFQMNVLMTLSQDFIQ